MRYRDRKIPGVMMPTTPTGSRVTSTSTCGGSKQALARQAQRLSAKNLKLWRGARTSPTLPAASAFFAARRCRAPTPLVQSFAMNPRISARSWIAVCPGRLRGDSRIDRHVRLLCARMRIVSITSVYRRVTWIERSRRRSTSADEIRFIQVSRFRSPFASQLRDFRFAQLQPLAQQPHR